MKKGFTLVELLAVVLMVGVLMGIGMPQYRKVVDKARVTEAESVMRTIYDSSERLAGDFGYTSFPNLQSSKGNIAITRLDMFDAENLPAGCAITDVGTSSELLRCTRFWYKVNVQVGAAHYVAAKLTQGRNQGTYILFSRSNQNLYCQPAAGKTSDFCDMLGLDVVSAGLTF